VLAGRSSAEPTSPDADTALSSAATTGGAVPHTLVDAAAHAMVEATGDDARDGSGAAAATPDTAGSETQASETAADSERGPEDTSAPAAAPETRPRATRAAPVTRHTPLADTSTTVDAPPTDERIKSWLGPP
jgi:hypothetical protein